MLLKQRIDSRFHKLVGHGAGETHARIVRRENDGEAAVARVAIALEERKQRLLFVFGERLSQEQHIEWRAASSGARRFRVFRFDSRRMPAAREARLKSFAVEADFGGGSGGLRQVKAVVGGRHFEDTVDVL